MDIKGSPKLAFALITLTSLSLVNNLYSLPEKANVSSGVATFENIDSKTMKITASDKAIINYSSFDIKPHEAVYFDQPSKNAAVLNRVNSQDPSLIQGQLNSNGKIFLINPQGIVFGGNSVVQTGGLVASTLDIKDSSFLEKNNLIFSKKSESNGQIIIKSGASISSETSIALLSPFIETEGNSSITAKASTISLQGSDVVTIDFSGDGLISFALDDNPAYENDLINIDLKTADQWIKNVVNCEPADLNSTLEMENGTIKVAGLLKASRIELNGKALSIRGNLNASSPLTGGSIQITGDLVEITGARIDASGDFGGGSIRIGGDYQGRGELKRSQMTTVDPSSEVRADAHIKGDGGLIVLWSDNLTSFAGTASAQGGSEGGNGGVVETSSKNYLSVQSKAHVDTSATVGDSGSWLLDPKEITITAALSDENALEKIKCGYLENVSIAADVINSAKGDITFCADGRITQTVPLAPTLDNLTFISPQINLNYIYAKKPCNITLKAGQNSQVPFQVVLKGDIYTQGGAFTAGDIESKSLNAALIGSSTKDSESITISTKNFINYDPSFSGNISINGSLNGSGPNKKITIDAGEVASFMGDIGNITAPSSLDVTATAIYPYGNVTVDGPIHYNTAPSQNQTHLLKAVNSSTTLNGGTTFTSQNGDIVFDGDVILNGSPGFEQVNMITNGNIIFPSEVSSVSSFNTHLLLKTTNPQSNISFGGHVGRSGTLGNIIIGENTSDTPFADITFAGNVKAGSIVQNGGTGTTSFSSSQDAVPIDVSGPITLMGTNFNFYAPIASSGSFQLGGSGNAHIDSDVKSTSVTLNIPTNLSGNLTSTSGPITISQPLEIENNLSLNSFSGISLSSVLGTNDLTLSSGSGDVSVGGSMGTAPDRLASVIIQSPTANVNFHDNLYAYTLDIGNTGDRNISGSVSLKEGLTVRPGNTLHVGSLIQDGNQSPVTIGASITSTNGEINLQGPILLNSASAPIALNAGSSNIQIENTITASDTAQSLTLIGKDITLEAAVGQTSALKALNIQNSGNLYINRNANVLLVEDFDQVGTGPVTISSDINSQNGAITFANDVTIGQPATGHDTTFSAPTNVTFKGKLDGSHNLILNGAFVDFQNPVGELTPLASLTVNSSQTAVTPQSLHIKETASVTVRGDFLSGPNTAVLLNSAITSKEGNVAVGGTLSTGLSSTIQASQTVDLSNVTPSQTPSSLQVFAREINFNGTTYDTATQKYFVEPNARNLSATNLSYNITSGQDTNFTGALTFSNAPINLSIGTKLHFDSQASDLTLYNVMPLGQNTIGIKNAQSLSLGQGSIGTSSSFLDSLVVGNVFGAVNKTDPVLNTSTAGAKNVSLGEIYSSTVEIIASDAIQALSNTNIHTPSTNILLYAQNGPIGTFEAPIQVTTGATIIVGSKGPSASAYLAEQTLPQSGTLARSVELLTPNVARIFSLPCFPVFLNSQRILPCTNPNPPVSDPDPVPPVQDLPNTPDKPVGEVPNKIFYLFTSGTKEDASGESCTNFFKKKTVLPSEQEDQERAVDQEEEKRPDEKSEDPEATFESHEAEKKRDDLKEETEST